MLKKSVQLAIAVAFIGAAGSAAATEGSGSNFLNGIEQFAIAYTPPPGVYYLVQAVSYDADSYRNDAGDKVPLPFKKKIQGVMPRLAWVTDTKVLGGHIVLQAALPYLSVSGTASAVTPIGVVTRTGSKSGIGDLYLDTALSFSTSEEFHYGFGVTFTAPTGKYDRNDIANPGRNYWSVHPKFAVSYVEPEGWNADFSAGCNINRRNHDTGYLSGRELHADYAFGYGFLKDWVFGVGGFVYTQTTDDDLNGTTIANKRSRVNGIGPAIKYDNGYGLIVTAGYQKEFGIRNRFAADTLSLKVVLPF
jgi:hypothetical protein